MFWGGAVVYPLMLLYTLVSYRVFRGKVGESAGYGHH
jgi:cytochrome d ubiquinol oxidase subunit II